MTQQQLDGVIGGINDGTPDAPVSARRGNMKRRSNRTRYTGVDADALLPALGATDEDHKDW
jgi:hypothetical protein